MNDIHIKSFGLASVAIAVLLGCIGSSASQRKVKQGDQWLAMDDDKRELSVMNFVAGYGLASHEACEILEYDFKPDSPELRKKVQDTGKSPSEICLDKTLHFSRINRSQAGQEYRDYVVAITDFYKQNYKYRAIPTAALLMRLADGNDLTAAQLLKDVSIGKIEAR